jgi:long-subunit fatty acid transport protein
MGTLVKEEVDRGRAGANQVFGRQGSKRTMTIEPIGSYDAFWSRSNRTDTRPSWAEGLAWEIEKKVMVGQAMRSALAVRTSPSILELTDVLRRGCGDRYPTTADT